MKNVLLGISMVAIILAGVLGGCLATNAIFGENPFQIIQRWREEDAVKISDTDILQDIQGTDDASDSKDSSKSELLGSGEAAEANGAQNDSLPEGAINNAKPNEDSEKNNSMQELLVGAEGEDVLTWLIETDVSKKYDGYSITYHESDVTVNVWKDSITRTLELARDGVMDKDDWNWQKDHVKNSADYIYDCIKTSEQSDKTLVFNVLDDSDQETILFTITDTVITYDILE